MDKRLRFMTDLSAPLRVAPGSEVRAEPRPRPGLHGRVARPQAAALLADGVELLADYQDRLAAQDTLVRELPDLLMWSRARAASLGRSDTFNWEVPP